MPFDPRSPDQQEFPPRPLAITIICVVGVVGALFAVPLAFSGLARAVGPWYPPTLLASCVIGFVCMVGYWKMRRWAVYAYTAFFLLNQVVMFARGAWSPAGLLVPLIVVALGFSYLSRMR